MKPTGPTECPSPRPAPILLVGAVPHETSWLEEELSAEAVCLRPFRLTRAPGVLFLSSGIGPANAGAALAWVLSTHAVDRVVNLGSAGSFDLERLPLEAVALVREDHFGDMGSDLGEAGWSTSEELRLFLHEGESNRFPCEPPPEGGAAGDHGDLGFPLVEARAITVHHVTGTRAEARARRERTGALVESMEGAALALTCQRFRVPFHQLRGISNEAGAPRGGWRFREAGRNAQGAARALFSLGGTPP